MQAYLIMELVFSKVGLNKLKLKLHIQPQKLMKTQLCELKIPTALKDPQEQSCDIMRANVAMCLEGLEEVHIWISQSHIKFFFFWYCFIKLWLKVAQMNFIRLVVPTF